MSIARAFPIVYSPSGVGASTNAAFRASLHTLLSPLMAFTTITNGFSYTLSSPQGLAAKLNIWDSALGGDPDAVAFQLTSFDGTRVGFLHQVRAALGRTFSAHACPCQLLLWIPTVGRDLPLGTAFQCGIPFVPNLSPASACVAPIGPGSAEECWWSCSDWADDSRNFRWSFESGGAWSVCYNAHLMLSSLPFQELARLRLVTQALATPIPTSLGAPRTLLRLSNGVPNGPLYLDPMIMWGDTPTSPSTVKGQLFNCVLPSADRALDGGYTVDSVDFLNYLHDPISDQSKWSSLFLVLDQTQLPTGAGLGNYVY